MFGPEAKANLVPNFIKAKTPALLQGLMLENNLLKKAYIQYQDISQSTDGYWYAWFYEVVDFYPQLDKNKKVVEK